MRTTPQNIERFAEFADCGRVVVFDTETTGGSCSDEICQLAAAECVNGRLERTMNVYIRPTCEMRIKKVKLIDIGTPSKARQN